MAEFDIPEDRLYTTDDEWARIDGDRALVGVTDYAQQQLGDVVFIDLPEIGTNVERGEPFGVIESVKTVSDLYTPVSGEVADVNAELRDHPELVNEDCYGDGWMIAIAVVDPSEIDSLLDAEGYGQHVAERKE